MRIKGVLVLFIGLILVVGVLAPTYASTTPTWSEAVRLTNHPGEEEINSLGGSIAVDSNNRIHIVYYYGGNIYHLYDNQGYINETIVAQATGFTNHPEYMASPVIGIDKTDTIHILYYSSDGKDYEIYYTHSKPDGSFTEPQQITDNDVGDIFPQLAIDENNVLHVVYQVSELVPDPGTGLNKIIITLKYINSTGPSGFTAPISIIKPSFADVIIEHKIALDKDNKLHVVYSASKEFLGEPYTIVYTNNSAGSFTGYDLINQTDRNRAPTIAATSNNTIFIGFWGSSQGSIYQDLYLANNSAGSFNNSIPEIISTVTFVQGPELLIMTNNTLNFVFYGYNETWQSDTIRLLYLTNRTGSYNNEAIIVTQELDQIKPNTILDSNNNIHIVYVYGDDENGVDLYYATTSNYYPTGVGPLPDPTLTYILIGSGIGVVVLIVVVFIYKKFLAAEKELWEPKTE
ncbi:MAG: hypothetical protein ACTSQY_06185 [Candidatus Odinarchaeia archaeon]